MDDATDDDVIMVTEPDELLQKYVDRFKLGPIESINFHVNAITNLPQVYGMHFDEYHISYTILKLDFDVVLIASRYEKEKIIRKLTINIKDPRYKDELRSCVNYLQRQRDIKHALGQLLEYAKLHLQRDQIGSYLMKEIGIMLILKYVDGKGFLLECMCSDCFYFATTWMIQWDCRFNSFFDYINFEINLENAEFHRKVKPIMYKLTKSSNDVDRKLALWIEVLDHLREALLVGRFVKREIDEDTREIVSRPNQFDLTFGADSDEDEVRVVEDVDFVVIV